MSPLHWRSADVETEESPANGASNATRIPKTTRTCASPVFFVNAIHENNHTRTEERAVFTSKRLCVLQVGYETDSDPDE